MALDTSGESVWFTLYWWGEVWESYSSWSLGWCLSLCWEWNWKWKWKSVWVAFPFSRGSSHPGIKPRSPMLQVDSLPAEPQGKPKNAGVGSLSFLQQIFLTQESNATSCCQLFVDLWNQKFHRLLSLENGRCSFCVCWIRNNEMNFLMNLVIE